MMVLSQPALEHFTLVRACKHTGFSCGIPVIDPEAKNFIVQACEESGFFKVVNHGVPLELMTALEAEAVQFFSLPQSEKDRAAPPDPFGYGSKRIGPNGDGV